MSVSEYVSCFTQLVRSGRALIATESDNTTRFLKGVDPGLKERLGGRDFPTFQHLINKVILKGVIEAGGAPQQGHHGVGSSQQKTK